MDDMREEEPLFRSVVADLKWQPEDLGPPFDVRAAVAASYAEVQHSSRRRRKRSRPARQAANAR